MKNKLVAFWKGLGFVDNFGSSIVVSSKKKRQYI